MENLNQYPISDETKIDGRQLNYSLGDIKRVMLNARGTRKHSDEVDVRTGGRAGLILEEISERTFIEADKLYEENGDWVNHKLEEICERFPNLEQDKLKDSFLNGLRLHIKRVYRTYIKDSPGNLNIFDDRQYIKDLIIAYTAEYILLLRQVRRTTESPNIALAIAEKTHFITESNYRNLVNKYCDLGYGAINTAAIGYSSDPERFLGGVTNTITRLKDNEKYAGLWDNTINRAATGYPSNPEKFLDSVIETVARLKEKQRYVSLGDHAINMAATGYPSNPERFLDNAIETAARLRADVKYSSLKDYVFNVAVIGYPNNPERFLDYEIITNARLNSNEKIQ